VLVQLKLNLVVCLETLFQGLYMNFSVNVLGFQKFCDVLTQKKKLLKNVKMQWIKMLFLTLFYGANINLWYHIDALRRNFTNDNLRFLCNLEFNFGVTCNFVMFGLCAYIHQVGAISQFVYVWLHWYNEATLVVEKKR